MELFLSAVAAVTGISAVILSVLRYRLELKRSQNTAWETAVRLMVSDPNARVRSDDFADLVTALRYLEKHPDCTTGEHRTLSAAMWADQRQCANKQ